MHTPKLEKGKIYPFLKQGQRIYWLTDDENWGRGQLPLMKTEGNQKLSRPIGSIKIIEVTHILINGKVCTKGLYQVIEVFERYSIARTIFDSNFQVPVRIGDREINGLLKGGDKIKISMIEKDKEIQVGDFVFTASAEFPYGMKLGEISEIEDFSGSAFKEAFLLPSISINELRNVLVIF